MYKTCKVSLSCMIWCKIYYLFWKFCRYRPTTPYSGRKILVCLWYHSSEINCNVYPDPGFSWYGSSSVMAWRSRPKAESSDVDERVPPAPALKLKTQWGSDATEDEGLVRCWRKWRLGGMLLKMQVWWAIEASKCECKVKCWNWWRCGRALKIKAWRYAEASKGEGLVGCKWRWDRGPTWYCRNRYAFLDELKITK